MATKAEMRELLDRIAALEAQAQADARRVKIGSAVLYYFRDSLTGKPTAVPIMGLVVAVREREVDLVTLGNSAWPMIQHHRNVPLCELGAKPETGDYCAPA